MISGKTPVNPNRLAASRQTTTESIVRSVLTCGPRFLHHQPMREFHYRLLNVFAQSAFSGNPLCVFEDGTGLDDSTMLNLARQFNLSETVFLFQVSDAAADADASMRIFTPTAELPFAGHPSIGAGHVLRQMHGLDSPTLSCRAGKVALRFDEPQWTLTAPRKATEALLRPCEANASDLCRMLNLDTADIAAPPLWIDTGSEQLLLPLNSPDAVARASPAESFSRDWPVNQAGRRVAFLFAPGRSGPDPAAMTARYFFRSANGVAEDPGTGSACVNLGAWLHVMHHPLPLRLEIHQGDFMGRPCRIRLDVLGDGEIRIGGQVIELGAGVIRL